MDHKTGICNEMEKIITERPEFLLQELRANVRHLTIEECWLLLKTALPHLERNKARDLVRVVQSGQADFFGYLQGKTADREERQLAIECLSFLPSRETVEVLVGLLGHKDDLVQISAAGALKNHTPRLVVPYLIEALMGQTILPARAGEVLLAMGYLAQDAMLDAYPAASPDTKTWFLELMVLGEYPKCLPLVKEALQSPHGRLKSKALDAVAAFSFIELWPQVLDCLLDSQWSIRAKTLEVLAKLGIGESREYMDLLLDDEDEWVRQCADRCIAALDEKRMAEKGVVSK